MLSVEDRVEFLDTRSSPRRQAEPRWLDAYTVCHCAWLCLARDATLQRASPLIPMIRGQQQRERSGVQVPGQYVGVRRQPQNSAVDRTLTDGDWSAERLLAIASSPYDARRESSMLDASIIEVRWPCSVPCSRAHVLLTVPASSDRACAVY